MGKYFFRYRDASCTGPATLVELTRAEQRAIDSAMPYYEPTTAQRAHKWVKEGGHHGTALFIDYDGRVRYATDGY